MYVQYVCNIYIYIHIIHILHKIVPFILVLTDLSTTAKRVVHVEILGR